MNKISERNKNRQLRRQALKFVQEKFSNPNIAEQTTIPSKIFPRSGDDSNNNVTSASIFNWNTVRDLAISNVSNRDPYDDDGSSSSDEECGELDFRTEIQEWVVNFKVPAMYVDSLLPILRKKDPSMPKCCKTLVHTPKQNNIYTMDNGHFHFHWYTK